MGQKDYAWYCKRTHRYRFQRIFNTRRSSGDSTITNQTSTPITKNINGKNYTAKLGDTKAIKIKNSGGTEDTYLAQIIGFNHDTKSSDHSPKAGITFQLQNCLKDSAKMNSTGTNAGGWNASEMRNRL